MNFLLQVSLLQDVSQTSNVSFWNTSHIQILSFFNSTTSVPIHSRVCVEREGVPDRGEGEKRTEGREGERGLSIQFELWWDKVYK